MKIDDALKVTPALTPTSADGKAPAAGTTAKAESSGAGEEKVTLSPRSSELQSLQSRAVAEEAFDAGKVDAIKSAIVDGQFKVDAGKVADGLINTVKDLLSGSGQS